MKMRWPICLLGLMFLAPRPAQSGETQNTIASHSKDLVKLEGEKLIPLPSAQSAQFLKATYTVIYFSAGWCPDCRRFSPFLVETYNQQPKGRERFEVLLFSMDKNAEDMLKYMKTEKMTWPALPFETLGSADDLKKYYSGHGIPCLSVIDANGKLVLQSKSDQDGQEVLKALQDLLSHADLKAP